MKRSPFWRGFRLGLAYPFLLVGGFLLLAAVWPIELFRTMCERLRDESVRTPLLPNRRRGVMFTLIEMPKASRLTERRN